MVLAHLARDVRGHPVAVLQLDAERGVGQRLDDPAFHLNCVFLAMNPRSTCEVARILHKALRIGNISGCANRRQSSARRPTVAEGRQSGVAARYVPRGSPEWALGIWRSRAARADDQLLDQSGHGDLRCVAGEAEHRFAEEHATERHAVDATDQGRPLPGLDRMRVPEFVQQLVGVAHGRRDPGALGPQRPVAAMRDNRSKARSIETL